MMSAGAQKKDVRRIAKKGRLRYEKIYRYMMSAGAKKNRCSSDREKGDAKRYRDVRRSAKKGRRRYMRRPLGDRYVIRRLGCCQSA